MGWCLGYIQPITRRRPHAAAARSCHAMPPRAAVAHRHHTMPPHAAATDTRGSASGGCRSGGHRRNGVRPFPRPAAGLTLSSHAASTWCLHVHRMGLRGAFVTARFVRRPSMADSLAAGSREQCCCRCSGVSVSGASAAAASSRKRGRGWVQRDACDRSSRCGRLLSQDCLAAARVKACAVGLRPAG